MKKYNLKSIMHNAWTLFRKGVETFAAALRMAWNNAKIQIAAKAESEVTEETHTWAGWKALGFEVRHGSTAIYSVMVADPATKTGYRKKAYFGASQVQPIPVQE